MSQSVIIWGWEKTGLGAAPELGLWAMASQRHSGKNSLFFLLPRGQLFPANESVIGLKDNFGLNDFSAV